MNVETIRFKNPPHVNTVDWEDFQARTEKVFQALGDILGKTLGAYGAPTLISSYPYAFVTKDGYRIATNVVFNKDKGEPIDRVIRKLAMDICSRLNFAVGDGTTTAIMATNEVYQACCKFGLDKLGRRPKDILEAFNGAKDAIVKEIEARGTRITEENLLEDIRKIVTVSTNGNKLITDLIVEAYDKIGAPGIVLDSSDTPDTYLKISEGYKSNVRVNDRIYVNSGKGTCDVTDLDVLIFSHRVEKTCFEKIIAPMDRFARAHKRRVLCLAPYYDEDLLSKSISQIVRAEYEKDGEASLIIGAYLNRLPSHKKSIEDLAMLLNTTIIDKATENQIIERIDGGEPLNKIINMDFREIPGIYVFSRDGSQQKKATAEDVVNPELDKFEMRAGFAKSASLGEKTSVFVCTAYNENAYQSFLEDARLDLEKLIKSNEALGSYTKNVQDAQERYMCLKMKVATLYLGGDSDLSRNMLKDSVTDAIRAAESAYRYGYIHGCNLTTINTIRALVDKETDKNSTYYHVLEILHDGFRHVYLRILENAFKNLQVTLDVNSERPISTALLSAKEYGWEINLPEEIREKLDSYDLEADDIITGRYHLTTLIEFCSEFLDLPFDLERLEFSDDIINSVRTDMEVLTAVVDLLGILIAGNQVILYQYNEE